MKPLYSIASLRSIEAKAIAQGLDLIQRAGQASAEWLLHNYGNAQHFSILLGPGNNGQDALACATQLRTAGKHITLHLSAALSLQKNIVVEHFEQVVGPCQHWGEVIVDGLFGIGLNKPLDEAAQALLASANQSNAGRVALDIPSGLNAGTGSCSENSFIAHHTLSFIADKAGFYTAQGRDHIGAVHTFDLGMSKLLPKMDSVFIDQRNDLLKLQRPHASHKGRFGTVLVIGGQRGMLGAALLAARSALHSGAGKVYVGLIDPLIEVDFNQPELMLMPAADALELGNIDAIVLGPGLGKSGAALAHLSTVLKRAVPLILDADALNLVATHASLGEAIRMRNSPTLLTPHPTEAARLLGQSTQAVQENRLEAARELATQYQAVVALKGSGTVCCDGENLSINGSGNALLANAGQGDVLSGLAGALLAQGLSALAAAQLACFAHGQVADQVLLTHPGAVTLPASQLLLQLSQTLNQA